ncbi:class I SAM-dependent methyltransferase [Paradevosia shaoguanensis]|uniref:Class I SAM-dependent methyltransferase n=1 Tax=Paradevosia shaoguanensis TaxID=1335043 RepID=A0AA41QN96_9HYPH|nr:class I SAM-dependent methyltransferase [Paradevosia shaoguanensis]MCF1743187.1 class I SAM-dependent methyltransferase [Paradevosia shaoguanensis]MCI0127670.1 class I SAM-dependent methyltransferase [Paradevosia shaoguanensis]
MSESTEHWQTVYTTKKEDEVSWFETSPEISLALIGKTSGGKRAAIVDIGGGASRLVDALLPEHDVTVLDLSAAALDSARNRLGAAADNVGWVVSDVTRWHPTRAFDVWHDRAALHFLTDPEDQRAYVAVLKSALRPGGTAILATFAPDGPEKCSGLPVARHDADTLAALLGPGFKLQETLRHTHKTPWGSEQRFQYSAFKREED